MNKLSKVVVNSDHNLVTIPVRYDHFRDQDVEYKPLDTNKLLNDYIDALQTIVRKRAEHCINALQEASANKRVIGTSEHHIEYISKGVKKHFGVESYNKMVDFLDLKVIRVEELCTLTLDQILKSFIYFYVSTVTTEETVTLLQSVLSEIFIVRTMEQ